MMAESPQTPSTGRLEIAHGVYIPAEAMSFGFARSGGPGGQNVNKVSTKVEVWVPIAQIVNLAPDAADRLRASAGKRLTAADELHLSAETARSQHTNREIVLQKLRELIAQSLRRPKVRRATRPSAGARRRRLEGKKHRGEIKSLRRSID